MQVASNGFECDRIAMLISRETYRPLNLIWLINDTHQNVMMFYGCYRMQEYHLNFKDIPTTDVDFTTPRDTKSLMKIITTNIDIDADKKKPRWFLFNGKSPATDCYNFCMGYPDFLTRKTKVVEGWRMDTFNYLKYLFDI